MTCLLDPDTICGGGGGMTVYEIVARASTTPIVVPSETSSTSTTSALSIFSGYPAPTSTGTPDCDVIGYDGTVNDDYLILCDTALPGTTLDVSNAVSLEQCIDYCKTYLATNGPACVGVEYDSVSARTFLGLVLILSGCYKRPMQAQILDPASQTR
jgi:hypothetical protein